MKRNAFRFKTRRRLFHIWQKAGVRLWHRPRVKEEAVRASNGKDFFRGSFDSIPFLNDDAKRTFIHLLLRPGYMIRDYVSGKHDIYLAPLTSLIIFYAFFALVMSIVKPDFAVPDPSDTLDTGIARISLAHEEDEVLSKVDVNPLNSTLSFMKEAWVFLHLDQEPEAVDTRAKASVAAVESVLRSQGVPEFLGRFLLMWIAMFLVLRRPYGFGISASASAAAYVLCQYCFFMLFALVVTWGQSSKLGLLLMGLLLAIDYRQLFQVGWKKSIGLTVRTGLVMLVTVVLFMALLAALLYFFVYRKA